MRCSSECSAAALLAVPRVRAPAGLVLAFAARALGGISAHFDGEPQMPLTLQELPKAFAAGFEVGELIEAGAARGEQDDLAGGGCGARRLQSQLQRGARRYGHRHASESLGDQRSVFADQVDGASALLHGGAQRREVLVLALTAEDQVDAGAREG